MPTATLQRTSLSEPQWIPGPVTRFRRRAARWVAGLTALNCVLVATLFVLLCVVSEDWWVSAALGYLPRCPWLAPSLLLIIAALLFRRSLALVNVLTAVVVAGPIMGLTAPLSSVPPLLDESAALTVISCNVQNGAGDLDTVLAELDPLDADVIALQETSWGVESLAEHLADWNTVHVGEFWVSSRHPVRLIDECTPEAFERTTAILCEIDAPQGTFLVCNVHLSTARHGLTDLRWHSPISGAGVDDLEWRQWQRRLEAEETVKFIAEHAERPLIILGDFNTPANSTLLTDVWNGYTSAFDAAGWGYGYTSPCNTSRLWPANTPWLRIDHIFCDDAWQVHRCAIGASAGSDHRLIYAWLSLR